MRIQTQHLNIYIHTHTHIQTWGTSETTDVVLDATCRKSLCRGLEIESCYIPTHATFKCLGDRKFESGALLTYESNS